MSRDDDSESRRKISNAFLDRRQDSLDHFRHQQRLTRTVYGRDKSAARSALGVQSSPGGGDEVAPGASVLDEMRRYRLMVCEEIDALTDFSREVRLEWRNSFDCIDLWRLTADERFQRFEMIVRVHTTVLRDILGRLGTPIGLLFGSGFDAAARKIQILPFLNDAIRQSWVDELKRIDATYSNPLGRLPFQFGPAEDITQAKRRLIAEIDSVAAKCGSLSTALVLLSSACGRYRLSLL